MTVSFEQLLSFSGHRNLRLTTGVRVSPCARFVKATRFRKKRHDADNS